VKYSLKASAFRLDDLCLTYNEVKEMDLNEQFHEPLTCHTVIGNFEMKRN